MLPPYQRNRQQLSALRVLLVRSTSRSTWGLTLLALACVCGNAAPAVAQVTSPHSSGGIESGVINNAPAVDQLGLDAATVIEDLPGNFVFWEHGPGQCCGDCPATWRVRADGLLLNYEADSSLSLSDGFFLSDFGYEQGMRLSAIRRLDCLDGWEVAYVGSFEWNEVGQANGIGLNSGLNSTTVNLSEFNNASLHREAYRGRLNSAEINRRWYGWDVISTLAGVRYMNVDEDFLFNSTGMAGTGELFVEANNHAVGPQVGVEMMHPLGNWMTTATVKGAVMLNSADVNLRLVNAGAVEVANADDNLHFASVLEFGYYGSYQLTPHINVRAGYEFWWLYGVAGVRGQVGSPVTLATGSRVDSNNNVYFHGATVGLEMVW